MILYVSDDSIRDSIEYFKSFSVHSPEQLGLFFFFKAIGITSDEYNSFPKVSEMADDIKKEYLSKLYNLSGVFDCNNEEPGKKTCLFPFSINQNIKPGNFYNGGTIFSSLLSRIRDTVDNTLIDANKFLKKDDANANNIKFSRSYIATLKSTYLKGEKISLIHLSAWYCRFKGFECPKEWISSKNEEIGVVSANRRNFRERTFLI